MESGTQIGKKKSLFLLFHVPSYLHVCTHGQYNTNVHYKNKMVHCLLHLHKESQGECIEQGKRKVERGVKKKWE